jgi:predicted TIM-barrel fold metal-dependent hydrolase
MNHYPFLSNYDKKLARMWGKNYHQQLPKSYLPKNYLQDMQDFEIEHLVMAELVSTDPVKEMHFAEQLALTTPYPSAAIANINLRDKNLATLLDEYQKNPFIRSVRDHLLWDPHNLQNCYTDKSDILKEAVVEESFAILQSYPFSFEFEIYAHEIPLVTQFASKFPGINFALHCLGWPLNQTPAGFKVWEQAMRELSKCPNVVVKITAIECIFGLNWTLPQIEPWIKTTIDIFGPSRCMFGSHLPIANLSYGPVVLYNAYSAIVKDLSKQEQRFLFADSAKHFYKIK